MTPQTPLGIFGWGLSLPPPQKAKDLIEKSGGDPKRYLTFGWENICVAGPEDYPLNFCVKALKSALSHSQIKSQDLSLVICTSTTHDYLEFCTASDVMKDIEAPFSCVGFDVYQGCVTTLTALEIAQNWLSARGGGFAAIVSGERWAQSMDKTDPKVESLWTFSDGGSALIVGVNTKDKPKLISHGTTFFNCNEMSGFIRRTYGGARSPQTPPGENPTKRELLNIPFPVQGALFFEGYGKVIEAIKTNQNSPPQWLVCNQQTPAVLEQLIMLTQIKNAARSGAQFGHVGCSDVVIGLNMLAETSYLKGYGLALSCSPSCFAASLLEAF